MTKHVDGSIRSPVSMIGRKGEFDFLCSQIDLVGEGNTRIVLIEGHPGIGKTRLCEAASEYAECRGTEVLWGRSFAGQGAPPYWPWIQTVRAYLHSHSPDEVTAAMESGVSVIVDMMPHIAAHLATKEISLNLSTSMSEQFRFFDAFCTFLENIAQRGAIAIVLDDLQWADRPSLELMAFISRHIPNTSLLLLGAARLDLPGEGSQLATLIGELTRISRASTIELDGLPSADTADFIDIISGGIISDRSKTFILEHCAGNPLFVSELVRQSGAGREFDPSRTSANAGMHYLTATMIEAIRYRTDKLSDGCARYLQIAAVIGREFSHQLVVAVSDDAEHDRAEELRDEAERAGIVRSRPRQTDGEEFIHDLFRDSILAGMNSSDRGEIHDRIGVELVAQYGSDASRHAHEIVVHFEHGVSTRGTDTHVGLLLAAGEQSLRRNDPEHALTYFERGLEIRRRDAVDSRTARLHFGVARARAETEQSGARAHLLEAFGYFEAQSDAETAVEVASFELFDDSLELVEMCDRCLEFVENGTVEYARVLSRRAFHRFRFGMRELTESRRDLGLALAIVNRHDDRTLENRVLTYLAYLELTAMRLSMALSYAERVVHSAQLEGDLYAECVALLVIYIAACNRRIDVRRGREVEGALLSRVDRLGHTGLRVQTYRLIAMAWADAGRCEDALRMIDRASELSTDIVYLHGNRALLLAHRAELEFEFEAGDPASGNERFRHARAISKKDSADIIVVKREATVAMKSVDAERASECAAIARLHLRDREHYMPHVSLMVFWTLAIDAVLRDDSEAAAEQLASIDGLCSPTDPPFDVHWIRGLLIRTVGELDESIEELSRAVKSEHEHGMHATEGWLRFYLSETYMLRGFDGDVALARDQVDVALALSDLHAMSLLESRCRDLLEEIVSGESATGCRTNDGYRLSDREIEVLRLVVQGFTNKEIGTMLYISDRTVGSHIRHILRKIGAANRTEATAFAIENGIAGPTDGDRNIDQHP